jgi:hypothetical protein
MVLPGVIRAAPAQRPATPPSRPTVPRVTICFVTRAVAVLFRAPYGSGSPCQPPARTAIPPRPRRPIPTVKQTSAGAAPAGRRVATSCLSAGPHRTISGSSTRPPLPSPGRTAFPYPSLPLRTILPCISPRYALGVPLSLPPRCPAPSPEKGVPGHQKPVPQPSSGQIGRLPARQPDTSVCTRGPSPDTRANGVTIPHSTQVFAYSGSDSGCSSGPSLVSGTDAPSPGGSRRGAPQATSRWRASGIPILTRAASRRCLRLPLDRPLAV